MHTRRELRSVAGDRVLERLQQQRDARELLGEAVVKVVADSLVLALAHLSYLGLEPPNLADEAFRDERRLARSRELALQLDAESRSTRSRPGACRDKRARAHRDRARPRVPSRSPSARRPPVVRTRYSELCSSVSPARCARSSLCTRARSCGCSKRASSRSRRRRLGGVEPEQLGELRARRDAVGPQVPIDQREVAVAQREVEPVDVVRSGDGGRAGGRARRAGCLLVGLAPALGALCSSVARGSWRSALGRRARLLARVLGTAATSVATSSTSQRGRVPRLSVAARPRRIGAGGPSHRPTGRRGRRTARPLAARRKAPESA